MDACINHECMHRCMDGWMDLGWMDRRMDGRMSFEWVVGGWIEETDKRITYHLVLHS